MEAVAVQKKTAEKSVLRKAKPSPAAVSWEDFQAKFLERDDAFKYEWIDGQVQKSNTTMGPKQLAIQINLQDFFALLLAQKLVTGRLVAEADLLFLKKRHRRPDFAWLRIAQVNRLLEEDGAIEVPAFVVEVISTHDASEDVAEKLGDYRKAGVRIVWQIFPRLQEVHVWSGERLNESRVVSGSQICSAAPVLPAFEIAAEAIFRKAKED